MSQKAMDRRLQMQSAPSSFFSEELRFPSERQVGFCKAEHAAEYCGTDGMMLTSGSKPVSSSPLEKLHPVGVSLVERLKSPQAYAFVEQKAETILENHLMGANSNLTNLKDHNQNFGSRSSTYVQPASEFEEGNIVNLDAFHFENSLFSSSFSEVFNKKISFSSNDIHFGQSAYASSFNLEHDEPESLEEMEAQTIGNLLPDSVDDMLSGIIDDEDYLAQPNNGDEVEDDLFYSGGGLELEGEDYLTSIKPSQFVDSGVLNCQAGGLSSQAGGEHASGEHPSRTLFVRNINSNVDDDELKNLFEQYGDIRTLYTVCKHRGFAMISYYDIRAAKNAMKALQHKPLRRRKLDIHYSIPKDNPSEKDINQGTLVVFNLDSSVSNDELRQIFGAYGEVKEIRETPNKNHHKFIEFYDIRSAEAALNSLNKCDIAGKIIKLEASRPGGARWCSTQQLSTELDEDEFSGYRLASPLSNSPPECFGSITSGGKTITGLDNIAIQSFNSISRDPVSPLIESPFHGLSSSVPRRLSSPKRVATVQNHGNISVPGHLCHSIGHTNFGYQCTADYHPHSLPDKHNRSISGIPLNSPSTMSAMDIINSRPANRIENLGHRVGSGSFNSHSLEHHEGGFGALGNGSCPVYGHQYFWNNSDSYHHHPPGAMLWQNSSSVLNNVTSHAPPQMHGFPRVPSHISNTSQTLHHHHVGSAPAMNAMFWDRRQAYTGDPMEASAFLQAPLGSMGFSGNSQQHLLDLASHNIFPHAGGNCMDNSISSAHVGIPSPQQRYPMFRGRNMMPGSYDAPSDRVRSRRSDASSNQADNRNQYELDIDRIMRGEDSRTTLMIKNIPNKYTSKMLLATIDEHHRGTYDFFYLPIDFKNKCNVGYAFINMVDPQHIISFYQAFDGKKWEKFNSEKVASLAYARIQGRPALIVHFQNSSLMNEDKRCRPILFHADGPNAGDQEPFPTGVNIRSRPGRSRTTGNDEVHQGSPSTSMNGEDSSNHTDSSGSTRGE